MQLVAATIDGRFRRREALTGKNVAKEQVPAHPGHCQPSLLIIRASR
jgi:hypothetical protein